MFFYRAFCFLVLIIATGGLYAKPSVNLSVSDLDSFSVDYLDGISTPFFLTEGMSNQSELIKFIHQTGLMLTESDKKELTLRFETLKKKRLSTTFSAVFNRQAYCFISPKNESIAYLYQNEKIFLDAKFLLIHELEHCVDWSSKLKGQGLSAQEYMPSKGIYREMYADVAASLYLSKKEGYKNIFDRVALFRSMAIRYNGDSEHWTYLAIKEAKSRSQMESGDADSNGNYRIMARQIVSDISKLYTPSVSNCVAKSAQEGGSLRRYHSCSHLVSTEMVKIHEFLDEDLVATKGKKRIAFYIKST